MKSILTIVRKELRGYFFSPIALIFLLVFLGATVLYFFTFAKFFARGIADLRPLFQSMPLLLLFLTAALTMRSWSEERRSGTIEILLTLPVRHVELVIGKFIAGTIMVAVALALTLPIAISVGILGDLDIGPAVGGYIGAFLLGAAYLAVGLAVSSATDNQLVSLLLSGLICAALYLIGHPAVVELFPSGVGEVLQAIGSSSRFASIERGKVDLRDLVYYASVVVLFLGANVWLLQLAGRDRRLARVRAAGVTVATIALIGVNLLLINAWLEPLSFLRVDLTEAGEHSVSRPTKELLRGLDAPVRITGFFSDRTHPWLKPLVPQVRDLLEEYRVVGRGKVQVRVLDPSKDPDLEKKINEAFGIEPFPVRFAGRHEESVVSTYFHILIEYGDVHEVLNVEDLIQADFQQTGDQITADVRFRNLEYDLSRAIRRVSQEFRSIDTVLAELDEPAHLDAYVSEAALPTEYAEVPAHLRKAVEEIQKRAPGHLVFDETDPSDKPELQKALYASHNIRPVSISLFGKPFYLHFLLKVGDNEQVIYPQGDMSEAELKRSLESAIQQAAPGFLKVVGLAVVDPPDPSANMPPQYRQYAPQMRPPTYQALERALGDDFKVQKVDLAKGTVPNNLDALIVMGGGAFSDRALYALDQFLMRGGSAILFTSAYTVQAGRAGLTATRVASRLHTMLKHYGIEVGDGMIVDPEFVPFPMPKVQQAGRLRIQRMQMVDYSLFPNVQTRGFAKGQNVFTGVHNVVPTWSSPVRIGKDATLEAETLLTTSKGSWVKTDANIQPNLEQYPDTGFALPDKEEDIGGVPVAVAARGKLESFFKGKESPLLKPEPTPTPTAPDAPPAADAEPAPVDLAASTIEESPEGTRLVVIGSATMLSDMIQQQLAERLNDPLYAGSLSFGLNVVDWSLEDDSLLAIRASSTQPRPLPSLTNGEKIFIEIANYVVIVLGLGLVVLFGATARRRVRPLIVPTEAHA